VTQIKSVALIISSLKSSSIYIYLASLALKKKKRTMSSLIVEFEPKEASRSSTQDKPQTSENKKAILVVGGAFSAHTCIIAYSIYTLVQERLILKGDANVVYIELKSYIS